MEHVIQKVRNHPYYPTIISMIKEILGDDDFSITKKRAAEFAKHLGFPLLGNGKFRFVINVDGFAVKIPVIYPGIYDNEVEKLNWKFASRAEKMVYLPCLAGDDQILVYPIVRCLASHEFKQRRKEIESIVKRLEIDDSADWASYKNWGIYEGRLILLDYADN